MNINLDLTTILTFVAGLMGPIAVLTIFSKVAVKLSLPIIIDALMESVHFLDRVATRMAKHPEMECAMKSAAEHKANNIKAGLSGRLDVAEMSWQTQMKVLRDEMDRDRSEERAWRKYLTDQLTEMAKAISRLDRTTAHNEGRHDSVVGEDSEDPA